VKTRASFFVCWWFVLLAVPVWAGNLPPVRTVFLLMLENATWTSVENNSSAPYINNTLLPVASFCEQYHTPPGNHPSLPNYLWLEAGTNFGLLADVWPATNHFNTTNHLVTQLVQAGISWRAYEEDISGADVPLQDTNNYGVRLDPFDYFDDVTGTNDPQNAYGIAHIRPYSEFAPDLTNNAVAQYNFITPNLIHDGHTAIAPDYNSLQQVDDWLASEIPKILQSSAYTNNGAIFITWDEGAGSSDGPIGLILLSPLARGGSFSSSIPHTHSSTIRTLQEIFGVQPWLGDAANANDLSELFNLYGFASAIALSDHTFQLTVTGVTPGQTTIMETSSNLSDWVDLGTNLATTNQIVFIDQTTANNAAKYYRCRQVP
jgi:hypothetical protein